MTEDWEEFRPCYYRRKGYSPEQIAILNIRPTDMINAALSRNVAGDSSAITARDVVVSDSPALCFARQEKS